MKIIIRAKNLDISDYLHDFIDKKIGSLKKLIKVLGEDNMPLEKGKTLSEVFIEIEKETKHHKKGNIFKAEAIINLPGRKIMAKSNGDDVKKLIVAVRKELEMEIRKYKTKKIELPRRKYRKEKREIMGKTS